MSTVGHPDFQEQAQWESVLVASGNLVVASGQQAFPVLLQQSSHWANIQLSAYPLGRNSRWNLTWYADNTHNLPVGGRQIDVWAGTILNVTVPNIGPFVEVKVTAATGGQLTGVYVATFNNRVGPPFYPPIDGLLYHDEGRNLNAGSDSVAPLNDAFSGPAMVSLLTVSPVWSLALQSVDLDGTVKNLYQWTQATVTGGFTIVQPVILPPKMLQLDIHNGDASARTFNVSVIADLYR